MARTAGVDVELEPSVGLCHAGVRGASRRSDHCPEVLELG
jgi:hypothetical protein